MIKQIDLGLTEAAQKQHIRSLIRRGQIALAGNRKANIYGNLDCTSGKRMNPGTRVFFKDRAEAIQLGYRPCGHCMQKQYQEWKKNN